MAVLSLYGNVHDEYVYGASLASFFFVVGDYLLVLDEKISGRRLLLYGLSFTSAILSLTILPSLFINYSRLYEAAVSFSVPLTLWGSGIVMFILGFKSVKYKLKVRKENEQNIEELEKIIMNLKIENQELKKRF